MEVQQTSVEQLTMECIGVEVACDADSHVLHQSLLRDLIIIHIPTNNRNVLNWLVS